MIKTINENKPEELLKTMTKNLLFSLFKKKKKSVSRSQLRIWLNEQYLVSACQIFAYVFCNAQV